MKRKVNYLLGILLVFVALSSSCEFFGDGEKISEDEIVAGLKKALEIGTDTACADLHLKDGYFGNKLVKILLPSEADVIFSALNHPALTALGVDKKLQVEIDKVVLAINRAAEDVADDAKPIFVNAITSMSIGDGVKILNGESSYSSQISSGYDSLAATHFMETATRQQLFDLYQPKMDNALDKDLGLGFSANEAWNTLITTYNTYAAFTKDLEPIENVSLSEFSANKGLDGLFLFVGNQEKQIRDNPYNWASDIIRKVFGSLKED